MSETSSIGHSLGKHSLDKHQVLALRGMRLPATALKRVEQAGIYCQPAVSIEHQPTANRYVIRGVESGGAIAELGSYCGFVREDGSFIPPLHRITGIAVNGLHAVVVSDALVRIQMFRTGTTYELLLTSHRLVPVSGKGRPELHNSVVFHSKYGTLEKELWGKDAQLKGTVAPIFYARNAEPLDPPENFGNAIRLVTAATCCCGCRHCHLV